MLQRILTAFLFVFVSAFVWSQGLQPTKNKALISLLVVDYDEIPIQETVELVSKNTGKVYTVTSSSEGLASLLVPINDSYTVNMKNFTEYDVLEIPSTPMYTLDYKVFYDNTERIPLGFAQIELLIKTTKEQPLEGEKVSFVSKNNHESYSETTGKDGMLSILLPINETYHVNFLDAPQYDVFNLPNEENYTLEYELTFDGSGINKVYPSLDKALIDFTYIDLDKKPVVNDTFYVENSGGRIIEHCITNNNGKAYVLVPIGDKYSFSTPYQKNFENYEVPNKPKLQVVDVTLKGISSIEFINRKKQREQAIIKRDSIYQAKVNAATQYRLLSEKDQLELKSVQIQNEANIARKELQKDPLYFEKIKKTVNAVLYRNRNRWRNQIIVTDVTCSMNPYLEEVLLWHAMQNASNNENEYIFFNDGNGKPLNEKHIGETGGLHYTNKISFDSVINKAWYAKSFGCSGDGPENDFEAVLEAVKLKTPRKEIILVADNYSDVRDYALLMEIDVPIRVILCGVRSYVHEQYLDLAYQTKGSVHSLEEDLNLLTRISEGKSITFGGIDYVLTKSGFIYKD